MDELVVVELHHVAELALQRLAVGRLALVGELHLGAGGGGGEVGAPLGDLEHAAAGRVRLERHRGAGIGVAHDRVHALDHGARIAARRRAGDRGVDRLLVVEIGKRRRRDQQRRGEQQDPHFFFLLVGVLRRFAPFSSLAARGAGKFSTASLKICTRPSTAAASVRVQRLGARDQLCLVLGVVELGEILAARLIQHEFDAKLGHWTSSLLGDNSRLPCAQSRSASRAGPRFCSRWTRPKPTPKESEILIKVAAAGVNRPDVLQRSGNYAVPPDASDLPGLEVAGEVVSPGKAFKIGDKVCALVHGGGYAEYCVAPEVQALPVPKGLSLVEAASLPETFFTVWGNVYDRGRLAPGETLLVQGGSSGIGVSAIQMAAAIGNRVFATAGSDEKVAACVRLGAAEAFNYKTQDFEQGSQGRHRRQGRRRDPRHGRRRLRAEGAEVPRRRRAPGVHRLPARHEDRARHRRW